MSKPRRPGPLRWLAYCFGFGLPDRYSQWVLHDVTGPTWVLRHIVRVLVQLSIPIVAIFVFIPAPMWVRLLTVITAAGPTLLFTCGYIVESADHRLAKAGHDPRLGERLRKERKALALERQRAANARRRERAAARLARR
jgi:hypothetical protein